MAACTTQISHLLQVTQVGFLSFFGNTMVVNGKVWPKVNLKSQKYRFALLNGCQSRYIDISF